MNQTNRHPGKESGQDFEVKLGNLINLNQEQTNADDKL